MEDIAPLHVQPSMYCQQEVCEEKEVYEEKEVCEEKEYLEQYALIVSREGNVPVCTLWQLCRLNHWFYDVCIPRIDRYYKIYCKFAPRLAVAEHRRLIAHPIEYTSRAVRTVPIPNLQGYGGGLLILNSDPPLFSDAFLADRRPALTKICLLTSKPVEFFYKIGFRNNGILRSGYCAATDYTVLPPYSSEEIERVRAQGHELPVETIMPGRYFVELPLGLDINPVLFAENLFHIDDLLFLASYHLSWHDAGSHLEPTLQPNVGVILDNFTHVIAQFATIPTALLDVDEFETRLKDVRRFSVVKRIQGALAEEPENISFVGMRADDLLK